jgi:hypothetical protein
MARAGTTPWVSEQMLPRGGSCGEGELVPVAGEYWRACELPTRAWSLSKFLWAVWVRVSTSSGDGV